MGRMGIDVFEFTLNFKLDSKIVIADEILFQMNAAHRTLGPKKVCFDFD